MKKRLFGTALALLMLAALLPAQVLAEAVFTVVPKDATVVVQKTIAAGVYEDVQTITPTDGSYTFGEMAEHDYLVCVKEEGYVTYEKYFWTAEDVLQNMPTSLTLVQVGDINGKSSEEGAVDITDLACLFEYLSTGDYTGAIADWNYMQAVADVNGDGEQNILDYQQLYGMIKAAAAENPEEEGQTTTAPFSGRLVKAGTFEAVDVPSGAQLAVTKRPSKLETTAGGSVRRYYPDRFQITGFAPMYDCDISVADYVLLNGSAVRAYLSTSTAFADGTTDVVRASIKGMDAGIAMCGQFTENVLLIGRKYHVVGGTEAAMWDGKGVLYAAEEAQPLPHRLANDDGTPCAGAKLTYDSKGGVTAISCAACKKIFTVSQKLPTSYVGQIVQVAVNGTTYFVLVSPGTSSGTTSSETTTSPKTG